MNKKFAGFPKPEQNWSKLPHCLIDALPQITTLAEMKVVLYVLRHTWGYQEFADWEAKRISTDEFMNGRKRRDGTRMDNGVGMSKPSIFDGLKRAVEHGFLVCYVDNTDLGRVTHYYRLHQPGDPAGWIYAMPQDRKGSSPWHNVPDEIRQAVYARFQGRCAYCEGKSTKWHYDHIVPRSRGGPDEIDNLALACPQCNLSKNDRTPDEWGHQVILYDGDVKAFYRGWSKFLTGGGKVSLPEVVKKSDLVHRKKPEKETREKETEEITSAPTDVGETSELPPTENPHSVSNSSSNGRNEGESTLFNDVSDPLGLMAHCEARQIAAGFNGDGKGHTVPPEAGGADSFAGEPLAAFCTLNRIPLSSLNRSERKRLSWAKRLREIAAEWHITPEVLARCIAAMGEDRQYRFKGYSTPFKDSFSEDIVVFIARYLAGEPLVRSNGHGKPLAPTQRPTFDPLTDPHGPPTWKMAKETA
jgi:hypothetical protein